MAQQKNRSSTPGALIAFFYVLTMVLWLTNTIPGELMPWLIAVLLIPVALLIIVPSFMMRFLGHMVGYVILAFQRYRQRHRANLHEEERPYEQGYQAISSPSNTAPQEPVTVQELAEPYEAPQAQYPQQQAPM